MILAVREVVGRLLVCVAGDSSEAYYPEIYKLHSNLPIFLC
jgi:hypothetical protein